MCAAIPSNSMIGWRTVARASSRKVLRSGFVATVMLAILVPWPMLRAMLWCRSETLIRSDLPGVTTAWIVEELVAGYQSALLSNFETEKDKSRRPKSMHLAGVVARAYGRQMKAGQRRAWRSDLAKNHKASLDYDDFVCQIRGADFEKAVPNVGWRGAKRWVAKCYNDIQENWIIVWNKPRPANTACIHTRKIRRLVSAEISAPSRPRRRPSGTSVQSSFLSGTSL